MIGLSARFGLGIALSTTGTGQATSRADPAHAFEPYEPLSGGGFTGPSVAASPDPLPVVW
ncbi:hypothetical protein DMA12_11790 [Amycolatopsis balhimycina DSM 5908]|uniref:Uncharacterized protein n=1 Tax=Amycolatopsis balhimycina DSM 5908 TaxID=1081091 RepID=A0A428WSD2_AMYBA|nr:hypothetical protein DMA12_11790 [Amycolatopsis balhimycina DSM 5908]